MKHFTVLGYSINDEVLCPSCIRTTPITGEKVSHICHRSPRPVPEAVRTDILALEKKSIPPGRIARHLRVQLRTVMRVIAGDDADAPSCPACEASKRSGNREIVPLYFADASVHEEICTYCGHSLLEIRLALEAERAHTAPAFHVEKTRHHGRKPALRFDRRPPLTILDELKKIGWHWDPTAQLWWWPGTAPVRVPTALALPPPPRKVTARPPIIRKAAAAAPTAPRGPETE